jgi:Bor protein
MHSASKRWLGLSLVIALSACYHASIETGLPASADHVTRNWYPVWIYGLVSASTVETAGKCKSGVAKVETQLSFVNMLVGYLTFGIYTPMQLDVTCAASNRVGDANSAIQATNHTQEGIRGAIAEAAARSERLHRPVLVEF